MSNQPAARELPIDWSTEGVAARRDRFFAASQRKFVPYETPLIFQRGSYQYLWDEKGNKYTDLLGMNLCTKLLESRIARSGHAWPSLLTSPRSARS